MHAFLQRDRLEIEFMIFVEKLETTRFESAFLPCASAELFLYAVSTRQARKLAKNS
jgi:hypothetical protein